jgi:hypothetical protein
MEFYSFSELSFLRKIGHIFGKRYERIDIIDIVTRTLRARAPDLCNNVMINNALINRLKEKYVR